MMVPWPVQQAMLAALADDAHVAQQKDRYGARRALLRPALEAAGYRVEHSEAGLYLWTTRGGRGRDGEVVAPSGGYGGSRWSLVSEFADLGILVAPDSFYAAAAGGRHVRIALTSTDERIDAAAQRLVYRGIGH